MSCDNGDHACNGGLMDYAFGASTYVYACFLLLRISDTTHRTVSMHPTHPKTDPIHTPHSTEWIKEHGGLCTEEDYPYTAKDGFCKKRTCQAVPGSKVVDWVDVLPGSEQAMLKALNVGPVSVAIEADQRQFQLYAEGVFTGAYGFGGGAGLGCFKHG